MSSFRSTERRIDPEDGKARTFEELQEICKKDYRPEQIQTYWETKCKPLQPTGTDPFMSNLQPAQPPFQRTTGQPSTRTSQGSRQMTLLAANPFLTSADHADRQKDVRQDPFLTSAFKAASAPFAPSAVSDLKSAYDYQNEEANGGVSKHWTETATSILGSGYEDRQQRARTILIVLPVLMYLWVLLIWTQLQHVTEHGCALLTCILFTASFTSVLMWLFGKRWGPVSLLALGLLGILAVCLGTWAGSLGWEYGWRQFWWLHTGTQYLPTSAGTPAGARVDAAILAFRNETSGPIDYTSVDIDRAAGFKDTDIFCAAPILSPDAAEAAIVRVNYWAVGINCCDLAGSFTCDASRESDGGYGVVQRGGGLPCSSCNSEKFDKAIKKAEALHGVVSVPGALIVKFVSKPAQTKMIDSAFVQLQSLFAHSSFGTME
eukprot:TRINITY_DN11262_c2_g1_i1.p1 TRINITY_DN11262_c2_g1~~TRINITY_DN11262_c2_g1_i1.p1  ORF type:complete len:433 (-),score=56.37 TRINITY_DN11262_c2_g1_i1:143-1441(-)